MRYSAVYEILCIKLFGSLPGIRFFLTFFIGKKNLLHVNSNPWILQEVYMEQVVVIVFSLLLEEPLDLAMLPFISLFHTVLHHNFNFLCSIVS
jgi:hypothetical protein